MKFYNREKEIAKLNEMREKAFTDHSRLSVVTGRRRVGKTSLITRVAGDMPMVYFFVGRKNEADLCAGFCKEIASKLDVKVPHMTSFDDVFTYLMELGRTRRFTLIIDEFQEFFNINPSVYSDIQNHWDRLRLDTHINLIVSGSIYSLINKIFKDSREPLFGRSDALIKLKAFNTDVIKEILRDYNPEYTNDDLLAFYMATGGVPKYAELLIDNCATDTRSIIRTVCNLDSPFRDEGSNILIEEFGRNYGTYFSILQAIASGHNTQGEISGLLNNKSIGGQLTKLEDTYEVISKMRPVMAKPGSQTVRYYISDQFLDFWFRYYQGQRQLVEMGLQEAFIDHVSADYTTYSGKVLERYFIKLLRESGRYREVGSYWEAKKGKEQREIDIVAIEIDPSKAVVAEVKRQRKEFKPEIFEEKVEHLRSKLLPKTDITTECLTLDDM